MKKFIIHALFLLVGSLPAYAQHGISYGFYLGNSVTTLSGVNDLAEGMSDTLSATAGEDFPVSKSPRWFLFYGGGFISYSIKPWISVRGGIEYTPKGEKFKGECYLYTNMNLTSQVIVMETKLKLVYVQFPVSVQLSTFSESKPKRLFVYSNFGIAPAVKLASSISVSMQLVERGWDYMGSTEEVISSSTDKQTLEGIQGFDIGAFCSIGMGVTNFYWEFIYDRGLININDSDGSDDNFKNNMFSLCFGIKFGQKASKGN